MRKTDIDAFLKEEGEALEQGLAVVQLTSGSKFIGDVIEVTESIMKIRRYKKVLGANRSLDVWVQRGYVARLSTISIDSIYAIKADANDD